MVCQTRFGGMQTCVQIAAIVLLEWYLLVAMLASVSLLLEASRFRHLIRRSNSSKKKALVWIRDQIQHDVAPRTL